ncbi:uncharacterized protein LOC144134911 [Amblyomma americanum]
MPGMSTVVEVASDKSPCFILCWPLTTLQRTKKEEETPWGCDCLPSASPYQRCQGWQEDIHITCREHAFIPWLWYQGSTQPYTSQSRCSTWKPDLAPAPTCFSGNSPPLDVWLGKKSKRGGTAAATTLP